MKGVQTTLNTKFHHGNLVLGIWVGHEYLFLIKFKWHAITNDLPQIWWHKIHFFHDWFFLGFKIQARNGNGVSIIMFRLSF